MLTVERVDDYLRVTGYPDGSDWIFRPPRPPERGPDPPRSHSAAERDDAESIGETRSKAVIDVAGFAEASWESNPR